MKNVFTCNSEFHIYQTCYGWFLCTFLGIQPCSFSYLNFNSDQLCRMEHGDEPCMCVSAYEYLFAAPRFLLYFPVMQNGLESSRLPIFSPAFLPVTRKV